MIVISIFVKMFSFVGIGSFIGGLYIKSLPTLGILIAILAIGETAFVIAVGGGSLGFFGGVITAIIAGAITGGIGYGISYMRRSKKTNEIPTSNED